MIKLLYNERKREEKEKDSLNDPGSDSEANLKLPKLKRLHIGSGKLKNSNIKSLDENDLGTPLNNFVCASCEREIKGELDNRMDFVPWNK